MDAKTDPDSSVHTSGRASDHSASDAEVRVDDALLDRYLAGETNAEESAVVTAWLKQAPDMAVRMRALATVLHPTASSADVPPAFTAETAQAWTTQIVAGKPAHAQQDDARTRQQTPQHAPHARQRWTWRSSVGVASACLIVLLAGLTWFHQSSRTPRIETRTYHTALGQRSTIRLADGSIMLLAPATSAVVTPTHVDLTGEAYFTIAPNTTRPIVVRTNNVIVHVLGTRFGVREYPEDVVSRVVVEDGKVALRDANVRGDIGRQQQPTVLTSAMLALVSDSGIVVRRDITVNDYTAWTNGTLVFDAVPLREVIPALSRAYGVEIRLDSALAARTMTLTASVSDVSLADILTHLAFAVDAHWIRNGSTVILSPGRPAVRVPHDKHLLQPEKQYGR